MSHTVCVVVDLMRLLASICIFKGNDKIVTRKFERATSNSIFHTKVCILSACSVHWTYFSGELRRCKEEEKFWRERGWTQGGWNASGMIFKIPLIPNSCKITILVEIEFATHHTISETVNFLACLLLLIVLQLNSERLNLTEGSWIH